IVGALCSVPIFPRRFLSILSIFHARSRMEIPRGAVTNRVNKMQFSEQKIQYLKSYISQLKPGVLSYLVSYFNKVHRSVILENIDKVFSNILSTDEKKKLMYSFYSHQIKMVKELIVYPFLTKKSLIKRTKIKGKEYIEPFIKGKKNL